MTTEKKIQVMVDNAIPLHPTCETERKKQIEARAKLRIDITELLREVKPFDPREQLK